MGNVRFLAPFLLLACRRYPDECHYDYGEPNDTPAQAVDLGHQGSLQACTGTDDDGADLYRIESPAYGFFHLFLSPFQAPLDLFVSDGETAFPVGTSDAGGEGTAWVGAAEGSEWYLEVRAAEDVFEASEYSLSLTFILSDDAYEPNDSAERAHSIAASDEVTAMLIGDPGPAARGLDDWYQVDLPAGTSTFTLLASPPDATVQFETWIDDEHPGSENASGSGSAMSPGDGFYAPITVSEAGPVRFRVFSEDALMTSMGFPPPSVFESPYVFIVEP